MSQNLKGKEFMAVVGVYDPVANAAAAVYTDYIDMGLFENVIGWVCLGDIGAVAIDASIIAYTDTSASNPTTIKSATQLGASATLNDNTQIQLECSAQEVNVASDTLSLRYVRFSMTPGGGITGSACILAIGFNPRNIPASDNDLASVQELVS